MNKPRTILQKRREKKKKKLLEKCYSARRDDGTCLITVLESIALIHARNFVVFVLCPLPLLLARLPGKWMI
jgi:hypothetical protein